MRLSIAATALVLGALTFAAPPAPAQTTGPVVHIKGFTFVPASLSIKAGTTVTFINDDDDAHTVTSVSKAFDSGGLDTRDRWTYTFTKPGTFNYLCAVHPYMKGVVTVTAP
jgi:plastocyanin